MWTISPKGFIHAGVHCRTVRRWQDQGLIFEWSKYQEKARFGVVLRRSVPQSSSVSNLTGFRHSEEVKRLGLDPEQASTFLEDFPSLEESGEAT